jgi:hypothetical protein
MTESTSNGEKISIEAVCDFNSLNQYATQWNRLAELAPQRNPMLSHAWISSFFEHRLNPDESWKCFFAYDRERLVGVLPVVIKHVRVFGVKKSVLKTPGDLHTSGVDFVLAAGREREVLGSILSELEREFTDWYCLRFNNLPDTSNTPAAVAENSYGRYIIREYQRKGCYFPMNKSYEKLHSGLGKDLKKKLKSRSRKLNERFKVEYNIARGSEVSDEYLAQFMELEAAGKKGFGGAIKLDQSLVSFYKRLVSRLSIMGCVEWYELKADGNPISLSLGIRFGGNLIIFKSCYDEDFSQYAPGNVLIEHIYRHNYSSGDTDEIDYLTDLPHHRRWNMDVRNYYNIYIYPRRFLPLVTEVLPKRIRQRASENRIIKRLYVGLRSLLRRVSGKGDQ